MRERFFIMNAKELKFLELFEELVKIDIAADKLALNKTLKKLMDFDYAMAVNAWEFFAAAKEERLGADEKFAEVVGFEILNFFHTRAGQKCAKAVADSAGIRRAVYQYSSRAGEEKALAILVDLLAANKVLIADELLKALSKNTRIHFGQTMKRILERVFIELLKKNPSKIEMNKKLAELFLTYIKKIKTEEKAMLEQRVKETR